MPTVANSLPNRIGTAFEATKSVGVALDVGRAAPTVLQAKQAGVAFGLPQSPQDSQAAFASYAQRPQANPLLAAAPAAHSEYQALGTTLTNAANNIGNWWSQTFHSAMTKEVAGFSIADALHSSAVQAAIRALEFTPEYVGNVLEARVRTARDGSTWDKFSMSLVGLGGPVAGSVAALAGVDRLWNPVMEANFQKSVAAESSFMQTMWLDVAEYWGGGTSTGIEADFDRLLDDPNARGDRERYFSHGSAHWVTGIGDALTQVFADPTIVGGKAAAVLKSARSTLKAADVSAAAASRAAQRGVASEVVEEGVEAGAKLTKKQARARDFVAELAERLANATDAETTARRLSETKWLKNSSYGATIAYAAARARTGLTGDAAQEAIETVIYAGLGHKPSLARLDEIVTEAGNEAFAVEFRRLVNPGLPDVTRKASDMLEEGATFTGDKIIDATEHSDVYKRVRETLDGDDFNRLERETLASIARRDRQLLRDTITAGRTPARMGLNTAATDAGSIARGFSARGVRSTLRAIDDSPLRVAVTKNYGRFVKPVHFLTGRHIPGTFNVTDPYKAAPVFESAVVSTKQLLKVGKGQITEEFAEAYAASLDGLAVKFAAVVPEAARKAHRTALVEELHRVQDEIVAARMGFLNDKSAMEKMRAAHAMVRGRRQADGDDFYRQVAYAAQDARTAEGHRAALVQTPDGEFVHVDIDGMNMDEWGLVTAPVIDPSTLTGLAPNVPAMASQLENVVHLVDPQSLLTHAQRLYSSPWKFEGLVARSRTAPVVRGTLNFLHGTNQLWKTAALLRVPAYTVRAMSDTLARVAVMLGALRSFESAWESLKNTGLNTRRISVPHAIALRKRLNSFRTLDHLNDTLIPEAKARASRAAEIAEQAERELEEALEAALRTPDPDPNVAAAARAVAEPDWQGRVWDDPAAYEGLVRDAEEAATLRTEEIIERLQALADEFEESRALRETLDARRARREEALRELEEAEDAWHNIVWGDAEPDEIEASFGEVVRAPTAADAQALQAAREAARERVIAAQKGLLELDEVDDLRSIATQANLGALKRSRYARQAFDDYDAARYIYAEMEAALDEIKRNAVLDPALADDRIAALLEAYQPSPEQIARLTDSSRPLTIVVEDARFPGRVQADASLEALDTLATLGRLYGREVRISRFHATSNDPLGAHRWAQTNRVSEVPREGLQDYDVVIKADAEPFATDRLVVDAGVPTPKMLRRTLGEERRRLAAELEEVAEAVTAGDNGLSEGLALLNRKAELEHSLRDLNDRYLAAQAAADERAGIRPRLVKKGKSKGKMVAPRRAADEVEKDLKKRMRQVAKMLRETEDGLAKWHETYIPYERRMAAGQATGGELYTKDRSGYTDGRPNPKDSGGQLARDADRAKGEAEEFSRHYYEFERNQASGEGLPELRGSNRSWEREAHEEAREAAYAAYAARRRARHQAERRAEQRSALEAAAARQAEVDAKRIRLEQIEARLAALDAGETTVGPLPQPHQATLEALEARYLEARTTLARLDERRRGAYQAEWLAWGEAKNAQRVADAAAERLARVTEIEEKWRAVGRSQVADQAGLLRGVADEAQFQVDDLAARATFLESEVKTPLEFTKPTGSLKRRLKSTIPVGKTVAQRRLGLGERLDLDGVAYRRGTAADPYRTLEEFESKMASFSTEDAVLGILYQGSRADVENLRRTGQWDMMDPTTRPARWVGAYSRIVNMHITKDALAKRILNDADTDDLLYWLARDPEGSAYFTSMREAYRARGLETDAEYVVNRARQMVDTILPPNSRIRDQVRMNGKVTALDIKRETGQYGSWRSLKDRPHIPYEMIELAERGVKDSRYFLDKGAAFRDQYFKIFAAMPEERMGRHPLYVARYKAHFENYVNNGYLKDLDEITTAQYDEARKYADMEARRDLGRFLFDTSDKSNMGFATQLLSPFYSAWEDSMVKWWRLLGEDPSIIGHAWNVMRAPNAGGLVVDNDGNRIDVYGNVRHRETGEIIGKAGIMDGNIVVPTFGLDLKGWAGIADFRFRKDGANVVFQGDPFWLPGPGPSLAIPTNHLVRHSFPELWREVEDEQTVASTVLRYLLPYGPSSRHGIAGDLEAALPAWVKVAALDMQGGPRYETVWTQLYQEQYTMERLGEVEKMDDGDRFDLINNRTRNWFLMRLMGTQSPVSLSPESPLAFYRKEYQRYRREFGKDAEAKFREDYPDYYDLNISASVSEAGISPTLEAFSAIDTYRRDIALNPEYGWFYAGAENLIGGFNQAAYAAQMAQAIDPAVSPETFRDRLAPVDAIKRARVSEGWDEYHAFTSKLNLALEEAGVGINKKEAAPLRKLRDDFVQDLKTRNKEWGDEFGAGSTSGNRAAKFLTHALEAYEKHPELAQRGDGQALLQYIEVREKIRAAMVLKRSARGMPGSGSLNAAEFDDLPDGTPGLRSVWETFVQSLAAQDAGFEQMYTRALSRDDLSQATYQGGN